MADPRKTYAWQKLRKARLTTARAGNEPCAHCGRPIDYTRNGNHPTGPSIDHTTPIDRGGAALPPITHLMPVHRRCNNAQGARISNKKRNDKSNTKAPVSEARALLGPPREAHIEIPGSPEPVLHPWGFPLPRLETPARPGTDYALADAVLEWIDANSPGDPLLPWQRYVVRRGFEVSENKLWRQVAFLVSRQQGKTYMMQRVLHARVSLAAEFGGTGNVLNTHQDAGQAVELVESLAREVEGGYLRARSNGVDWWMDASDVGGMGRGRVWRARAQTRGAITGQAGIGMVYLDELQNARVDVMNRTVRPILSAARVINPQVWFSGTGEREESDVLRQIRAAAFSGHGDTLWLEWSAPPGCATDDRVAWQWASPDWSEARSETLSADQRSMPDADFRSEYLVQHDAQVKSWVDKDAWTRGHREGIDPAAGWAVAVEADFDGPGGSAAAAWRDPRECACDLDELESCQHTIYVVERHFADLTDAFLWGQECEPKRWLVARSLMKRPEAITLGADDPKDKRVQPRGTTDTATALPELRRLLARERVAWDGQHLSALPRLRTKDHESVAQGLQLINTPDVPTGGIRCAAWAVTEVQRLIGDTLDDWQF